MSKKVAVFIPLFWEWKSSRSGDIERPRDSAAKKSIFTGSANTLRMASAPIRPRAHDVCFISATPLTAGLSTCTSTTSRSNRSVEPVPSGRFARFIFVDPDGNLIEVSELSEACALLACPLL